MTDTTKVQHPAAVSVTAGMDAPEREEYYTRRRRTTSIVVSIGLILVVALFIFMVTRPAADDTVPTSIGVSFNSFFQTLGSLGPIVQIPIVLLVFGIVVGLLLVLIEFAPRPGRGYFWLRLAACFVIPVLAFMLLRPYQNALIYVLAIAIILGGILFYADY